MTVRSIVELQRRLHETGRIRHGDKELIPQTADDKKAGRQRSRPVKLDRFRFTSASRRAIDTVAGLYGGTPEQWADAPAGEQWQVRSEADEIDVVVIVNDMSFMQAYELWSAGGCKRRCDGVQDEISGGPCLCKEDDRECKLTTRLSVMLAKVPGIGLWRIESHGFNAAAELAGSIDMAQILAGVVGRAVLPAKLRLEHKAVKRPKKGKPDEIVTQRFVVPVLDFDVDMAALAVGISPIATPVLGDGAVLSPAALSSGLTPVAPAAAPTIAQQVAEVDSPEPRPARANSAPPLPRTGLQPRPADQRGPGPTVETSVAEARAIVDARREAAEAEAKELDGPPFGDGEPQSPPPPSRRRPPRPRETAAAPAVTPPTPTPGPADEEVGDGRPTPAWCADLHMRAQTLELNADQVHACVSYITQGRTESTRDLKPREARQVSDLLTSIESDGVRVEQTSDGWEVVFP